MFSRVILRRIDPAAAASGREDDIEHQPLSPRDVEPSTEPEMAERSQRFSRLGMRRPSVPSRFRFSNSTQATSAAESQWPVSGTARSSRANTHPVPRPGSSHHPEDDDDDEEFDPELRRQLTLPSRYSVVVDLPSTRLHLPGLQRTWTQGSNGPPTARPIEFSQPQRTPLSPACRPHTPPTPTPSYQVYIREPERARVTAIGAPHTRLGSQEADELYPVGDSHSRGVFSATDPAEAHLAEMAEDGRRRRQRSSSDRDRRRRGGDGARSREEGRRARSQRTGDTQGSEEAPLRKPPKHFLFCFPWIKSRKMRSQILQCFVSGMFLVLLTAVYLALSLTKNITNHEFSILLILIILFAAIFFSQGLIRLCLLIFRPKPAENAHRSMLPTSYGPGGYAIPRQPIRVVLARDEEAAGIESETMKINPPAYGLWRESVRVDPNRIYWQRNVEAPSLPTEEHELYASSGSGGPNSTRNSNDGDAESSGAGGGNGSSSSSSGGQRSMPRPPSYASEDGVAYVIEARPRSIAPVQQAFTGTQIVPMPTPISPLPVHPSETGRVATPPSW